MRVILRMPYGREYTLKLPHWDNEFVGKWLYQIFTAFTNYPEGKGPHTPINYTITIVE